MLAAAAVAVCGIVASAVAFGLHEAAGHGLAAYALGGRFLGFFVSPTAAFADTAISDAGRPWVSAAGTPINLLTGLMASAVLRRRRRVPSMARITIWQFAHMSLVFQLLYVGGLPLVMWLSGQGPPQGDWSVVFARIGVHPIVTAAGFLPLCVLAAASLARTSRWLTPWPSVNDRRWGTAAAYLTLAMPPVMLTLVYALVTLPWSDARDRFELGGIVATPLTAGLAGAFVAQYRGPRAGPSIETSSRTERRMSAASVLLMIAILAGAAWVFGPTTILRRGVAVQPPSADDYFRAAFDVRISGSVGSTGRAELLVHTQPVTTRGSPYVRRFSRAVSTLGPSRSTAAEFTRFLARSNFGLEKIDIGSGPRRSAGGWQWSATADVGSGPLRVRLFPAIVSANGRVVELALAGVTVAPDAAAAQGLSASDGMVVWRRPASLPAPVQFELLPRR